MNGRRRCAIDFYSKEAYDEYMKQHPAANPQNHRVLPKEEHTKSSFDDRDNLVKGQKSLVEKNVKGLIAGMVGIDADSIKPVDSKTLLFTDKEHNSNKFHQFNIMQLPNGNYLVTDSYGRVGSSGKPQILSAQIPSLDDAKSVLESKVSGKQREGYSSFDAESDGDSASGKPSSDAAPSGGSSSSTEPSKPAEHPVFNKSFVEKFKDPNSSIHSSYLRKSEFDSAIESNGGWAAVPKDIADSIWKEAGSRLDNSQRVNLLYSNASDATKLEVIKTSGDKFTVDDISNFASSEKCPDSLVQFFAKGRNSNFKSAAIRNPKCPEDLVRAAASDRFDNVRMAVAMSPICDDDMALKIIQNHSAGQYALSHVFSNGNKVSAQVKNTALHRIAGSVPYVGLHSSSKEKQHASLCRHQAQKAAEFMIDNGLVDEANADDIYDSRSISLSTGRNRLLMNFISPVKLESIFHMCSVTIDGIDPNDSNRRNRVARAEASDKMRKVLMSSNIDKNLSIKFMKSHPDFIQTGLSNAIFTSQEIDDIVDGKDPDFAKYRKHCALAAARNENTTVDTLHKLVERIDSFKTVRSSTTTNTNSDGSVNEKTVSFSSNIVAPFVSANISLSDEDASALFDYVSSMPDDETKVHDEWRGYDHEIESKTFVSRKLLENGNLSSATVKKILSSGYNENDNVCIVNAGMNGEVDNEIAEIVSRNNLGACALMSNPRSPQSVNDANIASVISAIRFIDAAEAKYNFGYQSDKPAPPPSTRRAYEKHSGELFGSYGYDYDTQGSISKYRKGNIAKFIDSDSNVSSKAIENVASLYASGTRNAPSLEYSDILEIVINPRATGKAISDIRKYAVNHRNSAAVDAIDAISARRSKSTDDSIDMSKMSPELRERVKGMDTEELKKFIAWLSGR